MRGRECDEDGVPVGAAVVRDRITMALDSRGLYGPEVDTAVGTWEGNPAGDVDDWELGEAVPSREQLRLLAELTGYPVAFFFAPYERTGAVARICYRTGPKGMGRMVGELVPLDPTPPAAAARGIPWPPPAAPPAEPKQGTLF